jgi:GT2 family glycosyltransferase
MVKNDINCEWIPGAFSSYKTEVLKVFKFDEKLRAYSLWEDVDFSFRINKKFPGSLYLTPLARAVNEASPLGRRPAKLVTYILVCYHVYFFFKNKQQDFHNRAAFAWSWLGTFLFRLWSRNLRDTILLLKAYCYALMHLAEIKNGQFPFVE